MSNQKDEEIINIEYHTNKENKVKIFGKKFVQNNKDKCKIIYKDKEYDLSVYFNISDNYNNINLLSIQLKGINKIMDASSMF